MQRTVEESAPDAAGQAQYTFGTGDQIRLTVFGHEDLSGLQGHYACYGITGNAKALQRLRYEVERRWRKWLDRRSWRGRVTARGHPA